MHSMLGMASAGANGHDSTEYNKKALPLRLVRLVLRSQQRKTYRTYARHFPPRPDQTVLDLGINASRTVSEHYFFEHSYPFPHRVTAAGLEAPDRFHAAYPEVEYVRLERGRPLPFPDLSFDVVFCNAVLEHVGDRAAQREFLADILRVGRSAFLTTPNRWYPVELHTVLPLVHWLPTPVYRSIFWRLGFEFFSKEENLNLLDRRSLLDLLPETAEARLHVQRFLGPVSNLVLVVKRSA